MPVAGSAYTFTYATMGELLAWIIGWDLILEMFTGAAVIAKYWGVYLGEALLAVRHRRSRDARPRAASRSSWPAFLIVARLHRAARRRHEAHRARGRGLHHHQGRDRALRDRRRLLLHQRRELRAVHPRVGADRGRHVGRLDAVAVRVATGAAPAQYGVFGLLSAASLVFFAFIGFDVVATSAEEMREPAEARCRAASSSASASSPLLYVLVSIVMTGMVSYTELAEEETPSLATAFRLVGAGLGVGR